MLWGLFYQPKNYETLEISVLTAVQYTGQCPDECRLKRHPLTLSSPKTLYDFPAEGLLDFWVVLVAHCTPVVFTYFCTCAL